MGRATDAFSVKLRTGYGAERAGVARGWALLVAAIMSVVGWAFAALPASAANAGMLTLTDALERALLYHPTVIDAEQRLAEAGLAYGREQAGRRVQASISAGVAGLRWDTGDDEGPRFSHLLQKGSSVTVRGSWQLAPGTSITAEVLKERLSAQGEVASVSVTRQLLPSPRDSENTLLNAQEAVHESELRLARARASALIDVYRRYYGLQVEETKVRLSEAAAALADERYTETVRRFEHGLASETDVHNAALERDRAQASLDRARRELALTKAAFARDLGFGGGSDWELSPLAQSVTWTPFDVPFETAVERVLAASADYLAAQRNVRSAERRYEAAKADFGLQASLTAGMKIPEWQGSSPEFSVALGASYNFVDGGAREIERREAALALERAERALRSLEESIRADVARRLSDLEWLAAQIGFAARALELAERTHDARIEQAARGVVGERAVKESEASAAEARLSYIEAVVAYEAARLELLAAMGEAVEIAGVKTTGASEGYPSP